MKNKNREKVVNCKFSRGIALSGQTLCVYANCQEACTLETTGVCQFGVYPNKEKPAKFKVGDVVRAPWIRSSRLFKVQSIDADHTPAASYAYTISRLYDNRPAYQCILESNLVKWDRQDIMKPPDLLVLLGSLHASRQHWRKNLAIASHSSYKKLLPSISIGAGSCDLCVLFTSQKDYKRFCEYCPLGTMDGNSCTCCDEYYAVVEGVNRNNTAEIRRTCELMVVRLDKEIGAFERLLAVQQSEQDKSKTVDCGHGFNAGCGGYTICGHPAGHWMLCAIEGGEACPHDIFKKKDNPVELPSAADIAAQMRTMLSMNISMADWTKAYLNAWKEGENNMGMQKEIRYDVKMTQELWPTEVVGEIQNVMEEAYRDGKRDWEELPEEELAGRAFNHLSDYILGDKDDEVLTHALTYLVLAVAKRKGYVEVPDNDIE